MAPTSGAGHGCKGSGVHLCRVIKMQQALHGCMAARLHGCTAARLHGCMAVWLHGCMAARLCGLRGRRWGVRYIYCWHGLPGYWAGVMPGAGPAQQLGLSSTVYNAQPTPGVLEVRPRPKHTCAPTRASMRCICRLWRSVLSKALSVHACNLCCTAHAACILMLPASPCARMHAACMQVEPSMAWNPAVLAGIGVVDDPLKLYTAMHSYLRDAGVDGVKVRLQPPSVCACSVHAACMQRACGVAGSLTSGVPCTKASPLRLHSALSHARWDPCMDARRYAYLASPRPAHACAHVRVFVCGTSACRWTARPAWASSAARWAGVLRSAHASR